MLDEWGWNESRSDPVPWLLDVHVVVVDDDDGNVYWNSNPDITFNIASNIIVI